jgi:DNA polymerase
MNEIVFDGTLAGWRRAARSALARGCEPAHTLWTHSAAPQAELGLGEFALEASPPASATLRPPTAPAARVPKAFLDLAEDVACFRDDARWALLYRALWRLTCGEPHLLEVATDADIHALRGMAKAVHRDLHKMRAFVRFREVATDAGPWFVAWFEPQHFIVEANVPFFRGRFANMRWSILTPDACAHWDPVTRAATLTPGVPRSTAPAEDAVETLWLTYYAGIFNPARVKISAMTSEMPRHYWKNLPEAAIIPQLLAGSRDRVDTMVAKSAARRLPAGDDHFGIAPVPATTDLAALHEAASTCRACPLWRHATCVVFGEGPPRARVVLVGEQPGDQEDRQGKPFVGPAGRLLDRALAEAGVDRAALHVTNAVKHFKWEPRGKRRLHVTPGPREIAACRPWLEAELRALAPGLIVCLGATAAQSVTGRAVKVLAERGQLTPTAFGAPALITVHPSSLLRLPPGEDPGAAFARFVDDLRRIGSASRAGA